MLRESERKQMGEGFIQGKGTGRENFGPNLVDSHGFGSVECSKRIKYIWFLRLKCHIEW